MEYVPKRRSEQDPDPDQLPEASRDEILDWVRCDPRAERILHEYPDILTRAHARTRRRLAEAYSAGTMRPAASRRPECRRAPRRVGHHVVRRVTTSSSADTADASDGDPPPRPYIVSARCASLGRQTNAA